MKQFSLKIFFLKKKIVFPYCIINVTLGSTNRLRGIKNDDKIIAYPIRNIFDIIFNKNKLATLSEIVDIKATEKLLTIQLKGLSRVRINKINQFETADFEIINENITDSLEELRGELRKKAQELIFLINVKESDKLIDLLNYLANINQTADFITNYFIMDFSNRYILFNKLDIEKRSRTLILILNNLIKEMKEKIEMNLT